MNYNNMNWNGYQMGTYNFNSGFIDQYSQKIFLMHDTNRSGQIEMHEFPGMFNTFFAQLGLNPPSYQDIMFLMYTFDSNRDGKINFMEFRNMLQYMRGVRNF